MSLKPRKPAVARSRHNQSLSDSDVLASASTVSAAPAQSTSEDLPKITIEVADPEPFVVTAESPDKFVGSAFALLVSRLGDARARKMWTAVLKRGRGRPSNSKKYIHPAMLVPGVRRFRRKMPNASLTQVVTAFVLEVESAGIKLGASTEATVKRLVRAYSPARSRKNNS